MIGSLLFFSFSQCSRPKRPWQIRLTERSILDDPGLAFSSEEFHENYLAPSARIIDWKQIEYSQSHHATLYRFPSLSLSQIPNATRDAHNDVDDLCKSIPSRMDDLISVARPKLLLDINDKHHYYGQNKKWEEIRFFFFYPIALLTIKGQKKKIKADWSDRVGGVGVARARSEQMSGLSFLFPFYHIFFFSLSLFLWQKWIHSSLFFSFDSVARCLFFNFSDSTKCVIVAR